METYCEICCKELRIWPLKSQCKENKKTKNLCFDKYLQSEYLTALPPLLARLVFKARLRMYGVKDNFKIKYGFDLNCPFCRKEAETLQHILQCDCVPFVKHKTGISVNVLLQQRHNTGALKMGKVSEILSYNEKCSEVTIGP